MAKRDENYVLIVGTATVLLLVAVSAALWILKPRPPESPVNAPTLNASSEEKDKKDKNAKKGGKSVSDAKPWKNGDGRESSGAVWLPGTDQVLFVDDKDARNVLCVTIDENGDQAGDLLPVSLGTTVDDAEDITFDGTYIYVQGSQFRKKSNSGDGIVRFRYDPQTHAVSESQGIQGWKDLLIKSVPELANAEGQVRTEEAINIEGLGWDPNGRRLMLGFRNPLVNGMAMVVPVSFKDPGAGLIPENLSFAPAVKLDLNGLAIRSIEWDAAKNKFAIIAGATEGAKNEGFSLYAWDGSGPPERLLDLDKKIKPEGLTSLDLNGEHFLYIVGDAGYYQLIDDPIK